MEVRKPGYYWAKLAGEWIIVEYEFNEWSFMASEETTIKDSFFDEIDENRIVRHQRKQTVIENPIETEDSPVNWDDPITLK